ncbi:protease inhibitor I42 family protein [Streptomyces decoyicus]|uniref:protease inhibitor I42 family protein n=1 Tax=Streptomyces decoyicus TaxID=249567 RepID=UPI002E2FF1F7|nr:protease inhibitor I42 family protein [Streptomyces decoyicus]
MANSGISRGSRTLVIAVAIATLLIALYSVFSQLSAPKVYDADDTEITVSAGDRFSVKVADDPADGYRWIIAEPRPDPSLLKAVGERVVTAGRPPTGSGTARYLSFEAVRPGRTDLRLLRCRRCGTGAADERGARSLNFRVTVG